MMIDRKIKTIPKTLSSVQGSSKINIPINAAPIGSPSVNVDAMSVGVFLRPASCRLKASPALTTPNIPTQSAPRKVKSQSVGKRIKKGIIKSVEKNITSAIPSSAECVWETDCPAITLIAEQRPAKSGKKTAYQAKSVPSTILTKIRPTIAKSVAMYHKPSGLFL